MVLAIEPNATDTLQNKGVALNFIGKYRKAIVYYDMVLAIEPNDTKVLDARQSALNLTKEGK